MKLYEFIKEQRSVIDDQSHYVYLFVGKYQPTQLFLTMQDDIKKQGITLTHIDCASASWVDIQALLQTSFLGSMCVYWIQSLEAAKNYKDDMTRFLSGYQGPHRVVVYSSDEKYAKMQFTHGLVVECDDLFDIQKAKAFLASQADQYDMTAMAQFLHKLYKHKKQYTYDELSTMFAYAQLLQGESDQFFADWVDRLSTVEASLFTLSQYFWAQQEAAFFQLWHTVYNRYSDMFWVAYWSEQFFKAYYYLVYQKQRNAAAAKSVSFGLPFSFLKQDWHKYRPSHIQILHQQMYEIDHALKNGGSSMLLYNFFAKFFAEK